MRRRLILVILAAALAIALSACAPGLEAQFQRAPQRVIVIHGWGYQGCTFDRTTLIVDCSYPPPRWPKPPIAGPSVAPKPKPPTCDWTLFGCSCEWYHHHKSECRGYNPSLGYHEGDE